MAIPASDPRLAPVLVEANEVDVEPLERDSVGRLIFSDGSDVSAFVPVEPFRENIDSDEAETVLNTSISELTVSSQTQDVQTTTIS